MTSITQLEALTSAGLIRRARKALEKNTIQWGDHIADSQAFEFEGYQGHYHHQLVEQSACNCPASGICKHIIAAAIDIIENTEQTAPSAFLPPSFNQADLFKEAGKVITRASYKTISQLKYDVINIKEHDDHIEACWLDQRAIIGNQSQLSTITIESGDTDKQLIAALLYIQSQNILLKWPSWLLEEQQQATESTSQNRLNLLNEVKSELIQLAKLGPDNIQAVNLMELMGLVPRLKSHKLRSVANGIRGLQEWVELHTLKKGLDPTQHIMRQLGTIYALCESKHQESEAITDSIETLNVLCIGGHKWSAPSGALGLNMLLLSESGRVFHSSIVRSQKGHGFSGDQAWSNQGLWPGSPMNHQLPGQTVELAKSRLNRWGSLLIDSNINHTVTSNDTFDIKPIDRWEKLKTLDIYDYALLKPTRWLACEFNEVLQHLEIQLLDEQDDILILRQAHSEETANRISNLIDIWIWKEQPLYIVARHVMFNHHHQLEPVSVFTDKWVSLDFQRPQKTSLNLLQRLLKRLQKNKEAIEIKPEEGLMALLLQVEETLREYPYLNNEKIVSYIDHFNDIGLDLATNYLSEINTNVESYLKAVYLINNALTLTASWPIYQQKRS